MVLYKNLVWITGDIHHRSMGGGDQKALSLTGKKFSEVDLLAPYLSLLDRFKITPTLFITGKAIEDESRKLLNKNKNIHVQLF